MEIKLYSFLLAQLKHDCFLLSGKKQLGEIDKIIQEIQLNIMMS